MDDEQKQLWRRLSEFQFDDPHSALTFTLRLARENGWSVGYADRVVSEYRRFLFLAMATGHEVTPSEDVDQAWHLHLTYSRSYWHELCQQTLGRTLHHGPTEGGPIDAKKFVDQYEKTLSSYDAFFSHEPPLDIWPPAKVRFGDPCRYVRIDRQKVWVIRKPWHWLQPLFEKSKCSVFLALAPTLFAAWENPLDFTGMRFLAFFSMIMGVTVIGGMVLRYLLRPGENAAPGALDSYQVACLSGGSEGVVQAAVVSLIHRGVLKVARAHHAGAGVHDYRIINDGGTPAEANELEQRVMAACGNFEGNRFAQVVEYAQPAAEKIQHRLEAWGLLVPTDKYPACCWVPALLVFATMIFGLAKVIVGLQRGRPVGFLVALLGLSLVVLIMFLRRPLRTQAGDKELRKLRNNHARLKERQILKAATCDSSDFALAAALYGLPIVAFGDMLLLNDAWKYRKGPNSATSGCGTSGCGGGGGGGGCGGGCGGCGS